MDAPTDDEAVSRRRGPRLRFIVAGVVAVLVLAGTVVWTLVIPNQRPRLEAGERFGIDVSNHQHAIDWPRVAADDIRFTYIKATEGGDFVDERFRENWDGAARAGLDRGAYHYFTLCRAGADQADNFLRLVPRDDRALPPVVDLEFGGNCSGRPDRDSFLRELTTFVERVEAALGQPVVLYTFPDFDQAYGITAAFPRAMWIPSFFKRPDDDGWWIWQVTGFASVDGIDGDTDLNVMRGSRR